MADARRIAGVESFTVGRAGLPALQLKVGGTANVQASQVERETLTGATGVAGYREQRVAGFVEVECYDRADLRLDEMGDWSDVTGTLVTKSGKIYVVQGWLTDPPELSTTDGTFTLRFEGTVREVQR